jgi:hypothetical protein
LIAQFLGLDTDEKMPMANLAEEVKDELVCNGGRPLLLVACGIDLCLMRLS